MLLSSFSRNGLHPGNHDIAFEDVRDWLNKNRQQFSLIYICFRHKRYRLNKSTVFDTVSGHRLLISRAVAALADGGRVLVSSLIAGFELDPAVTKAHACNDLSRKLSSPDIVRGGRSFRCWEITKREVDESGAS